MEKYQELFRINLKHNYYSSGFTPDLELIPNAITEKKIRGHRCILKKIGPGRIAFLIQIDTEAEAVTPFIKPTNGTRLV